MCKDASTTAERWPNKNTVDLAELGVRDRIRFPVAKFPKVYFENGRQSLVK